MSVCFCIDRKLLGTSSHLFVHDDDRHFVDEIPDGVWHLDGSFKDSSEWCLDTLFKLNLFECDIKPEKKYVESVLSIISGSMPTTEIPWHCCMPHRDHQTFVDNSIALVTGLLNKANMNYYKGTWVNESRLLDKLQPVYVDKIKWRKCFNSWKTGCKNSLKEFDPIDGSGGQIKKTHYNRFGTRTGRLTVSSGPDILTLKKEHRTILTSKYDNKGHIVYVDFACLEARVILHESGRWFDKADLYEKISNDIFLGKWPRSTIKAAVLSDLYGISRAKLQETLGCDADDLERFTSCIRAYFDVDSLLKRIKKEFVTKGHITNRHGRLLTIIEPLDNILVNSYVQSTGVDISLLGFLSVVKTLEKYIPRARPLYVLHDALLVDVHKDDYENMKKLIKTVKVKGYVQKYFLHVSTTH